MKGKFHCFTPFKSGIVVGVIPDNEFLSRYVLIDGDQLITASVMELLFEVYPELFVQSDQVCNLEPVPERVVNRIRDLELERFLARRTQ